jgi:hypothetical protein
MTMRPGVRKLTLTAHVVSSVGWLGSVVAFLALSIAGLTSRSPEIVRGAYLAMNLIGQFIIVPLTLAALLTGLVQALGTHWGLFRYYWVLTKFSLTVIATTLLLLHQFTAVAEAARRASAGAADTLPDVGRLGTQLVADSGAAVLVLLVTTTLSVFKPWGKTRYGRRQEEDPHGKTTVAVRPVGLKIFLAVIAALLVGFVVLHLTGRGLGGH